MNILLVEDEAITVLLMKAILTNLGHTVVESCASGEKAVEAMDRHPVDLIFMDILLSGEMYGITTVEHINTKHNVPVIYATGYDDDEIKDRAMKTNPLGYLLKPVQQHDVELVLKKISMH